MSVEDRDNNMQNEKMAKELVKFHAFYDVLVKWILLRQSGVNISDLLKAKGLKTIAIYGMKELGELLLNELLDSEITVLYAIDKNAENIYAPIDIYTPDEELLDVDAVIVTAITFYTSIKSDLSDKVDCPIISLGELLKDYKEFN